MKTLIKLLLKILANSPRLLKEVYIKSKLLTLRKIYHKKFYEKSLKFNDEYSYYYLDPMPKENFLGDYYNSVYWKMRPERIEKNFVRDRDFRHMNLIQKHILENFKNKKCNVLNFGSGHAGISLLLRSNNHNVYNFDYIIPRKLFFKDNYKFINKFEDIQSNLKFDIIYSSHSLEHLTDVFPILKKFKEYSHKDTCYFFEVPNGYNQNRISPPHTLYFTRDFFEKVFSKKENDRLYFNYIHKDNLDYNEDVTGGVINIITNNSLKI
tara:strand:+ start:370 stop:1167 length:798 start_codon:yes stop_codon:yes gene_type:complete